MGKYSLLVFDWDGTLIDSKAQIVNCMQATIQTLSLKSRTDKQISETIGLGLEEAIRSLYPRLQIEEIKQIKIKLPVHYLMESEMF